MTQDIIRGITPAAMNTRTKTYYLLTTNLPLSEAGALACAAKGSPST